MVTVDNREPQDVHEYYLGTWEFRNPTIRVVSATLEIHDDKIGRAIRKALHNPKGQTQYAYGGLVVKVKEVKVGSRGS